VGNVAFRKVLVPVNGSDLSQRVVAKAAELVKLGVIQEVVLLSVWEADEIDYTKLHSAEKEDRFKARAQAVLDAQKAYLDSAGVNAEYVLAGGDPSEVIIEYVQEGFDLIVMGSRRINKVQELIFGSVSDRVTRLVDIPILVVK